MVRARIRHIFTNYSNKLTVQDYIEEPEILIDENGVYKVRYVARPVFNCMRAGDYRRKLYATPPRHRKYRRRHYKARMSRMANTEAIQSMAVTRQY